MSQIRHRTRANQAIRSAFVSEDLASKWQRGKLEAHEYIARVKTVVNLSSSEKWAAKRRKVSQIRGPYLKLLGDYDCRNWGEPDRQLYATLSIESMLMNLHNYLSDYPFMYRQLAKKEQR